MRFVSSIIQRGLLIPLICFACPAAAGEPSGGSVRGGGEFVVVPGVDVPGLELRELIDPSVCDPISGKELVQDYAQGLDHTLSALSQYDWYLAESLRATIHETPICLTTDLKGVLTASTDSVVQEWPAEKLQGAVFVFDERTIYLDFPKFQKLSPRSQGYTLIHEALHQYLSLDLPMRQQKLMSIVLTIFKVETTSSMSKKRFALSMETNRLDFPLVSDRLKPYRGSITLLLTDPSDWNLEAKSEAELLELSTQLDDLPVEDLAYRHVELARRIVPVLRDAVESALSIGQHTTPFTPERWIEWSQSPDAIAGVTALFEDLAGKDLFLDGHRLHSNEELKRFGFEDKVTEISHHRPSDAVYWAGIDRILRSFEMRVAEAVRDGRWDWLRQTLSESDAFYDAFGVLELLGRLTLIETPVAREKSLAAEVIDYRFSTHWTHWMSRIRSIAGERNTARFESMIDRSKLGY